MSERDDLPEHILDELLRLEAERERLQVVLDSLSATAGDATALVDRSGVVRFATTGLAHLVSAAATNLLGAHLEAVVDEHDRDALRALLDRARAGETATSTLRLDDGRTLELTAMPTPRGEHVTVRATAPASTTTGALADVLKLAVDHLDDIVFVTEAEPRDGGRRIVFVNRAFSETTGFAPEEVLGKTPNVTIGPLTDRTVLRRIEARLQAKRSVHEELLKYKKDGTCYWVELDILPMWDASGRHTHWVSVQRDITQRRAREAQAIENEHRTAVRSLAGRAETSLRPSLRRLKASLDRAIVDASAPRQSDLKRISESLRAAAAETVVLEERAREIVRDSTPRMRRPVDIREAVETAVAVVWRELRHNARLVRRIESVGVVEGSANQLAQAVVNVIRNAIEALLPKRIDDNEIVVDVRYARQDEGAEGERIIEVMDNGCGLASAARSRATEQFFTTKRPGLHDGLGLTFTASVLRSMGGRVVLSNRESGGAACRLILPPEQPTASPVRAD